MRIDCTASTQTYPAFETLRNKRGELFFYIGDVPARFGGEVHRKADKAITKGNNISSVYVPDVNQNMAYGDVKGTTDCVLIIFDADYTEIEIFVARGQRNNRLNLWQMLSGGELDDEISELRARAVTESVTNEKEK
jgi:hypothetical protein